MSDYRLCAKCIMDTSDPAISFDEQGVCNYCRQYERAGAAGWQRGAAERRSKLEQLVAEIKRAGERSEYDCVIGLSGGVDSSYVAYIAKQQGLRPLAVHIDNGWNSELAVKNIENIVRTLQIDLFTHVIDWEEFKDLQLAFFRASVVDIEMLSDNAIFVGLYKIAKQHKIKYILNGVNNATEAVMSPAWLYTNKYDSRNIRSIYKRFGGGKKLRTYPLLNLYEYLRYRAWPDVKDVSVLNYLDYNRAAAVKLLQTSLGWRDYGGKHWESKFTQFYQAYMLPVKFKFDKRRAHLSSLIVSGQIGREEALKAMAQELYPAARLREDKEYVLKKLGLSDAQFAAIMALPVRSHYDYPSYNYWYLKLWRLKLYGKTLLRKLMAK
jgi:N-acetyl sugar amidotransferase